MPPVRSGLRRQVLARPQPRLHGLGPCLPGLAQGREPGPAQEPGARDRVREPGPGQAQEMEPARERETVLEMAKGKGTGTVRGRSAPWLSPSPERE